MVKSEFSKNLKILIKNLGITQKEFAEELNVNKNAVSAWITGKYMPNLDMLERIYEFVKTKDEKCDRLSLLNHFVSNEVKEIINKENSLKLEEKKISREKERLKEIENRLSNEQETLNKHKAKVENMHNELLKDIDEIENFVIQENAFIEKIANNYNISTLDILICKELVNKIKQLKKLVEKK